jgi:hypothetical protein
MNDHTLAGTLYDREAVRDVITRYGNAIDRADLEQMKTCFHEDAVDEHGPFSGLAWGFAESACAPGVRHIRHHVLSTPFFVSIDERSARVSTPFYGTHIRRSDDGETDIVEEAFGRYLDRLERREDGPWRIAHRRTILDHTREAPRSVPWIWEEHFHIGSLHPNDWVYRTDW